MSAIVLLSAVAAASASMGVTKTPIVVPGWPKLPFPFETGLITCTGMYGCMMHVSGLPGIDFTKSPPSKVSGGIVNETAQALTNIATVAKAANSSMDNFMECTVLLSKEYCVSSSACEQMFNQMNSAYKNFFGAVKPTRAAYFVTLVGDSAVEIKCSGWAPAPLAELAGRADAV